MSAMPLGVAGVVFFVTASFCPADIASFSAGTGPAGSFVSSPRSSKAVAQSFTFQATGNTSYVWTASPSPAPPYCTWATAARTIQDAIDAAESGDTILVTNGLYASGGLAVAGLMTNRVALTKSVLVQSINGPGSTIIQGSQLDSVRCAYVGSNALLIGFTLTNGGTRLDGNVCTEQSGGGIWAESSGIVSNCLIIGNTCEFGTGAGAYGGLLSYCTIVSNSARVACGGAWGSILHACTLTGNSGWLRSGGASDSILYNCTISLNKAEEGGGVFNSDCYNCLIISNRASYGAGGSGGSFRNCVLAGNEGTAGAGGVSGGTLFNCLLTANTARRGGAASGTLYNCTVSGNSALDGGGTANSTLVNSIVYYNVCGDSGPNYVSCNFSWSCTFPLPAGIANLDAEPGFVNLAADDYRLVYDSPCIDAGTNLMTRLSNDLAGLPRPLDGRGAGNPLFDLGAYEFDLRTLVPSTWLLQYGLDPNDPSLLSSDIDHDSFTTFQEWVTLTEPTNTASIFRVEIMQSGGNVNLSFQSYTNRFYSLLYTTNVVAGSTFWNLVAGQENIPGTGDWQTLQDSLQDHARFYKVFVDFPR